VEIQASAGAALFGRHVAEAFEDLDRVPLAQQSDRTRDGRGVDAGSGVVEPVEKPDADPKCFGDQIVSPLAL
jgi:hypothetical protein